MRSYGSFSRFFSRKRGCLYAAEVRPILLVLVPHFSWRSPVSSPPFRRAGHGDSGLMGEG